MKRFLFTILVTLSLSSFSARPRLYPTSVELKSIFLEIKSEYLGVEGYKYIADKYFFGNMHPTYEYTSSVLSKNQFSKLGWGKTYGGTAKEHDLERLELLTSDGKVRSEYIGIEGYKNYANLDKYAGKMKQAFSNASAVLSEVEFKELYWPGQFVGSVKEFILIREILTAGTLRIDYNKWYGKTDGLDQAVMEYMFRFGYTLPYNKKTLMKVRRNTRAATTKEEKIYLGWDATKSVKQEKQF